MLFLHITNSNSYANSPYLYISDKTLHVFLSQTRSIKSKNHYLFITSLISSFVHLTSQKIRMKTEKFKKHSIIVVRVTVIVGV